VFAFILAKKDQPDGVTPSQVGVLVIMFAQMLLGLIMAQIHIYSWAQVLHVGLAAILLALVFRWYLITSNGKRPLAEASGRRGFRCDDQPSPKDMMPPGSPPGTCG
jgi:heme A synthase